TISVTEAGSLFWNDEPATRQLIESKLSVAAQKTPQPTLNIRRDRTTPYRLVNHLVKIAQAQAMLKIRFVTTPPKRGQYGVPPWHFLPAAAAQCATSTSRPSWT